MAVYPDWKSYPPKDAASYKGSDLDPDADGKIDHADLENVNTAQHHDPANQVEGESAGLREEHGQIHIDELASASNTTASASFATAFNSRPQVLKGTWTDNVTNFFDNFSSGTDEADPVDTSGFSGGVRNDGGTATDAWIDWMAIGS